MKTCWLNFLIYLSIFLVNCSDDDVNRNIYEGELIPGTEVFFPMGFLGSPKLMPKVSPDGRYLAYQNFYADGETEGIWILDMEMSKKRLLIEGGYLPDWSPDGQWIAFNTYPQIHKIKFNGDSLTQLTFEGNNFYPDWSPDGRQIAFYVSINEADPFKGVKIMDENGNENKKVFTAYDPDWSLDGSKIIGTWGTSATSSWVKFPVYDLTNNQITVTHDAVKDENNQGPRFSPNNDQIVFFNSDGIFLLYSKSGEVQKLLENDLYNTRDPSKVKRYICCPSWYPDGEHIVYQRFEVTDAERGIDGTLVEGYLSFYKLNVDSAMNNFP